VQNLLTPVEEASVCLLKQDPQNGGSNHRKYVLDILQHYFPAGLYSVRKRMA
jgi:hypothetical protein